MKTEVDKIMDLEYDELITLAVIESDEDLKEIFYDDVKISYNMLLTLSKENKLNKETKEFIRKIFDKLILINKQLINKYVLLAEGESKNVMKQEETQPVIQEPKEPEKKEKILPRRYGKMNIVKDIQNQGGKATNAQLAALEVNDLKNIYVNLNNRLINDLLTDNPRLTDEDYRDIRSAIKIVKAKMKNILKK
jgi:hypothetical protein